MNKIVRVGITTVAFALVVAGTVWAQTPGFPQVSKWKAPTCAFPDQCGIAEPINTGNSPQDRGGTIDFSKSSSTSAFQFGAGQAISVLGGGMLHLTGGDLGIETGDIVFSSTTATHGIKFSDSSYQVTAGISQAGKLCRVVIQPFVAGDGINTNNSGPVYDTIPARDSWLVADCIKYASDTVPPGSGYTYPALIGCAYPGGLTAFGAPTAAGYWDVTTLPNNCGWNPPPPPAAKTGVPPGFKERPCPTYDWRNRLWTYCP